MTTSYSSSCSHQHSPATAVMLHALYTTVSLQNKTVGRCNACDLWLLLEFRYFTALHYYCVHLFVSVCFLYHLLSIWFDKIKMNILCHLYAVIRSRDVIGHMTIRLNIDDFRISHTFSIEIKLTSRLVWINCMSMWTLGQRRSSLR